MELAGYSERAKGFRLGLSSLNLPEDVLLAERKACRTMSTTTYAGKKIRVRFLDEKLIDDPLKKAMHDSLETYHSWVQDFLSESKDNYVAYVNEFCQEIIVNTELVKVDNRSSEGKLSFQYTIINVRAQF